MCQRGKERIYNYKFPKVLVLRRRWMPRVSKMTVEDSVQLTTAKGISIGLTN